MHVRELCPKDFYFAQILRTNENNFIPLLVRLILNPEQLENFSYVETKSILDWMVNELLDERVLTVENWLELAFHLCKQRWDSSIDWMETQPMSKILTMVKIVEDFAEKQNQDMKKASRR